MNQPKVAEDVPAEGVSPDHNPTGTTPHGIPEGLDTEDAAGQPESGRLATETAVLGTEKG